MIKDLSSSNEEVWSKEGRIGNGRLGLGWMFLEVTGKHWGLGDILGLKKNVSLCLFLSQCITIVKFWFDSIKKFTSYLRSTYF